MIGTPASVTAAFAPKLLRYFLSGGAPLAPEIARFFLASGIFIGEGYGLTETSAGSVGNRLDDFKFGTVGKAGEGVGVRIAEDGEIQINGRGVMRGYYKDKKRTKAAKTESIAPMTTARTSTKTRITMVALRS